MLKIFKSSRAKFVVSLVVVSLALGALFLGVSAIAKYSKPSLSILVSPVDAVVEIDGEKFSNGEYEMKSGKKHVRISKDGFETKELDLDIKSWHSSYLDEYLVPDGGDFSRYATSEDDYEALKMLDLSNDEAAKSFVEAFENKMTITDFLPIATSFDLGDSKSQYYRVYLDNGNADCLEFFCLKIESNYDSLDNLKGLFEEYGYNLDGYSYIKTITEE